MYIHHYCLLVLKQIMKLYTVCDGAIVCGIKASCTNSVISVDNVEVVWYILLADGLFSQVADGYLLQLLIGYFLKLLMGYLLKLLLMGYFLKFLMGYLLKLLLIVIYVINIWFRPNVHIDMVAKLYTYNILTKGYKINVISK